MHTSHKYLFRIILFYWFFQIFSYHVKHRFDAAVWTSVFFQNKEILTKIVVLQQFD